MFMWSLIVGGAQWGRSLSSDLDSPLSSTNKTLGGEEVSEELSQWARGATCRC